MDIIEILKKYGANISKENIGDFKKDFYKSYKSIAEFHHLLNIRRHLEKDLKNYKILVEEMRKKKDEIDIENQKIKNELIIYHGKEIAKQAGVDFNYIDFVTYKILSLTYNIHDFDDYLKVFLETHQEYKK